METNHEGQNGSKWQEWDLGCGWVTKREESRKVQVGVHNKVQGGWFSWESIKLGLFPKVYLDILCRLLRDFCTNNQDEHCESFTLFSCTIWLGHNSLMWKMRSYIESSKKKFIWISHLPHALEMQNDM